MKTPRYMRAFTGIQRVVAFITTAIFFGFIILMVATYVIGCAIKEANPPSVKEAPYIIQTSSRVYYASVYEVINGVPTITGYWTSDGKKYHYTKAAMPFPKKEFGQIAVIRRSE